MGACEVSIPPSSACNQLHSWTRNVTTAFSAGTRFHSISGNGGAVDPADQIATGVSIAEPYPVDVVGTLSIGFESDAFSNDPAIQFSTGGRTAPFRINLGWSQDGINVSAGFGFSF